MRRTTIRSALEKERPLITPLAHDALSARLIEMARFHAFGIGGSAMLAVRHALPDLGLAALGEMAAGIGDIAASNTLPFFADADDGYGDVKNVVRTVKAYESMDVGAILIEDQQLSRKQQRADAAIGLVDEEVMEQKLRAALAVRRSPETWIIGRTDAFGLLGLDAALKRADRFLRIGVDGVFIAGIKSLQDYERIGTELKGAFLMSALFEDRETRELTPAALGKMGFGQVAYPTALILRSLAAMRSALTDLQLLAHGKHGLKPLDGYEDVRATLDEALNLSDWRALERQFAHGANSEARRSAYENH